MGNKAVAVRIEAIHAGNNAEMNNKQSGFAAA